MINIPHKCDSCEQTKEVSCYCKFCLDIVTQKIDDYTNGFEAGKRFAMTILNNTHQNNIIEKPRNIGKTQFKKVINTIIRNRRCGPPMIVPDEFYDHPTHSK